MKPLQPSTQRGNLRKSCWEFSIFLFPPSAGNIQVKLQRSDLNLHIAKFCSPLTLKKSVTYFSVVTDHRRKFKGIPAPCKNIPGESIWYKDHQFIRHMRSLLSYELETSADGVLENDSAWHC